MKETIATIPLMNAFHADDECPFCYLEREAEQHAISFILGSAYMEDDIRAKTDATGFCRHHFKMMYDYGNRLGNALILSTHLKKLNQELGDELAHFTPGKSSFIKRMKHTDVSSGNAPKTPLGAWIAAKTTDCYVCDHFHQIYGRYLDTFFDLYKKNEEFRALFEKSRGFCLPHFGDLIEAAEDKLTDDEKKEFYPKAFSMMQDNLDRLPKRSVLVCGKKRLPQQGQGLGYLRRQHPARHAEVRRRLSRRRGIQGKALSTMCPHAGSSCFMALPHQIDIAVC